MQHITRQKDGKFRLEYPAGSSARLEDIPGLAVGTEHCVGAPDCVSVAARRLGYEGLKPWPLPESWPRDLGLGKTPFTDLYKYQKKGVIWARDRCLDGAGVVIADDMGLGKSAECLAVCKLLRSGQVLIVCPASVRLSWQAQVHRWCREDAYIVDTGEKAKALPHTKTPAYVVSSYELAKHLPSRYTPDALIIDEAHNLCGRNNQRVRDLSEKAAMAGVRIATTGTPIRDRPRDWFMLLQILFRTRFGNAAAFDFAYCAGKPGEHGGIENKGVSRADELKHRLSFYMLRREKGEVGHELPALARQVHWMPPDKLATASFRHCTLRQGTSVIDALLAAADAKVEAACDMAADARSFFLVTWTKRHAHELHRRLNDERNTPCYLITGEVSDKKRKALVALAAEERCGIVATMDSVGTGFDGIQHVTQTGIAHMIGWKALQIAQTEARLHRIGQMSNVDWHYLAVKDSMDERVVSMVVEKLDQWRAIMGQRSNEGLRNDFSDSATLHEDAMKKLYEDLQTGGDDGGK